MKIKILRIGRQLADVWQYNSPTPEHTEYLDPGVL